MIRNALLLLCLFAGHAVAGPSVGEVVAIRGVCFDISGGQRIALKQGDPVSVGDMVEVPDGARLRLRMVDGSVLSAASGTTMTIQSYRMDAGGRDVGLRLAGGLLRAVVAHMAQPSRFEVQTATGVAAVRSTDWFLRSSADMTQVGVLQGRVALTSLATHAQVVIPARWGAKVLTGRDPVPPRLWTRAEFADVIDRTDIN
jgi:hypothetical protein